MTTLIVTPPLTLSGVNTEYDYVTTDDGLTVSSHGRALGALLPSVHKLSGEVVVVVPARALSWHRLTLPKGTLNKRRSDGTFERAKNRLPLHKNRGTSGSGNPLRLRAVLSGLLEEHLLDEPEHLHFAVAPDARSDEPAWVAVCDRAWLHAVLKALEAAQRPVSRIVPEFTPDVSLAQQHTLYVTAGLQPAQLNVPHDHGVTVLPLSSASLALLDRPLHNERVAETELVAEPDLAAMAERLFQRPVRLQSSAQRWLLATQTDWNLAQFDLINTVHARNLKRLNSAWQAFVHAPQWRAARWGSVLFLSIHLLGLNAWAWKEQSVMHSKHAAIRATLTETFPEVKVIVDAPLQMARALSQLQQATGTASGQDLEAILGHVSALIPPQQSLKAIEFSEGQARLKGLSLSAQASSSLAAELKARGYAMRSEADSLLIRQEPQP